MSEGFFEKEEWACFCEVSSSGREVARALAPHLELSAGGSELVLARRQSAARAPPDAKRRHLASLGVRLHGGGLASSPSSPSSGKEQRFVAVAFWLLQSGKVFLGAWDADRRRAAPRVSRF